MVFNGTIEPALPDHVATTFEAICWEVIWEAVRRSDLEPYSEIGEWWYGEHEIDIIGLAPNDDRLLLAEYKWTTDPVEYGLAEALRTKTEHVQWKSKERRTLRSLLEVGVR